MSEELVPIISMEGAPSWRLCSACQGDSLGESPCQTILIGYASHNLSSSQSFSLCPMCMVELRNMLNTWWEGIPAEQHPNAEPWRPAEADNGMTGNPVPDVGHNHAPDAYCGYGCPLDSLEDLW